MNKKTWQENYRIARSKKDFTASGLEAITNIATAMKVLSRRDKTNKPKHYMLVKNASSTSITKVLAILD